MKIGIQMFSLRNYIPQHGIEKTLDLICECGYDCIEPIADYYGTDCNAVAKLVKSRSLGVYSMHVPYNVVADYDELKRLKDAFGFNTAVIPGLPKEIFYNFNELKQFIEGCLEVTRRLNLTLAYHNHNFEFDKDGYLASLPQSLRGLKLQPDVYWLKASGITPIEFLRENSQNIALIHLKEYGKDGSNPVIGQGSVCAADVIKFAADSSHRSIILEFEAPLTDEAEYMKQSARFIREALK